jgi:hypothetical protein
MIRPAASQNWKNQNLNLPRLGSFGGNAVEKLDDQKFWLSRPVA